MGGMAVVMVVIVSLSLAVWYLVSGIWYRGRYGGTGKGGSTVDEEGANSAPGD
jgi:hypothetical protein